MKSIEERLSRLEARRESKQDGNYIIILEEAEELMQKCLAACLDEHEFYRCVGSAHAMIVTEREERNEPNIEENAIDPEIAARAVMLLPQRGMTV